MRTASRYCSTQGGYYHVSGNSSFKPEKKGIWISKVKEKKDLTCLSEACVKNRRGQKGMCLFFVRISPCLLSLFLKFCFFRHFCLHLILMLKRWKEMSREKRDNMQQGCPISCQCSRKAAILWHLSKGHHLKQYGWYVFHSSPQCSLSAFRIQFTDKEIMNVEPVFVSDC